VETRASCSPRGGVQEGPASRSGGRCRGVGLVLAEDADVPTAGVHALNEAALGQFLHGVTAGALSL
jgi:hypothetical protein